MDSRLPADIRVIIMGLALAVGTGTEARAQVWTKVDLGDREIWTNPDSTSWRKDWEGHRSPLASDHAGRVYVANGPTLLTVSRSGTQVVAFTPAGASPAPRRALAAGGDGMVLWGEYRWDPDLEAWLTLVPPRPRHAYGLFRDGTSLASAELDGIERASRPQGTWIQVHTGRTFGQIERFLVGKGGQVFALPTTSSLLHSHDTGRTWMPWREDGQVTPYTGATVRAMGLDRSWGTPLYLAMKHPRDPGRATLVMSQVWYRALDSVDLPFPDTLITSVAADAYQVWVGTRGQGVWTGRNPGMGLAPANSGLTSLDIEALEVASDGSVYALARDGLYRTGPVPTRLAPLPSRAGRDRSGRARLFLPGSLGGAPSGSAIRADGRAVLLPETRHRP